MTESLEKQEKKDTEIVDDMVGEETKENLTEDPTRFGDWQKNGRCIDF